VRYVIEIRFHGMGGQGAVMSALILAEAAFSEGKFAQKIPVYGGMRRGGDATVFLRLDDKPIRRTSGIYEPDALVVLDPSLEGNLVVQKGLKKNGMAILNAERDPSEVDFGVELRKTATVAATGARARWPSTIYPMSQLLRSHIPRISRERYLKPRVLRASSISTR
jgi:pyruvate ferredoxin oxidoreductase gamma subunit/2-oxoisovalerate ferredoxin oxidoreductase gamma subunit